MTRTASPLVRHLRSLPRVDWSAFPGSYAVQRCPDCEVAFAYPASPSGSMQCPACGQGLWTTTRRLRAGFVVLTREQVKAIQDANGYARVKSALAVVAREQRFVGAAFDAIREERHACEWVAETPGSLWATQYTRAGLPEAEVERRRQRLEELDDLSLALSRGERRDLEKQGQDLWKSLTRGPVDVWGVEAQAPEATPASPDPLDPTADFGGVAGVQAEEHLPVEERLQTKDAARLEAAVTALAAFDAKPRCRHCWGYNASFKKSDLCGSCREWGTDRTTADGDRDQYAWKRQELVARVTKYGGTPAPSPLGDAVAIHERMRDAKRAEARERRIAGLRAGAVRAVLAEEASERAR